MRANSKTHQQRVPVLGKDEKISKDKVLLIGFGITGEDKSDPQVLRRIYKSREQDLIPRGRAFIIN